jgi:DNA-binding protein HU-beta
MTQQDLIDILADKANVSKKASGDVLKALAAAVEEALHEEGEVTLPGLGKLHVAETKARKGRNPATGEPIEIPAGQKVSFKVSTTLKAKFKN